MSFYITIKSAKLSPHHQQLKQKVSVVITSKNNRLFSTFVPVFPNPIWQDAFVAQGSQRQLDLMLIQQTVPNKSGKRLSSGSINLSKYLFEAKDQTDQINLQYGSHIQGDKLTIQVCYRQNKNFIGPIQFYKKGSGDFDQDQFIDLEIQGDKTKFPFWRKWFIGGDDDNNETRVSRILDNDDQKDKNKSEKDSTKFYKGAHKNRNIFSLCDQVYDDQKFTVVQNYYNHQ